MKRSMIYINKNNLLFNYHQVLSEYHKTVCAVVKANAYGHGIPQIVKILNEEGVRFFAVATLLEAIEVRKYSPYSEILILGKVETSDYFTCYHKNFSISILSISHLKELISSKYPVKTHLKLNSGLNRNGLKIEEIDESIILLKKPHKLRLDGIYSHMNGGAMRHESILQQNQIFEESVKKYPYSFKYIHINSSSNAYIPSISNLIRIGIDLYGLDQPHFLPVLSLYCPITSIIKIEKNEGVGYNYNFIAKESGYIITIPLGYGDGMIRTNHGVCYVENQLLPQASYTCMDYTMFFSKTKINEKAMVEIIGHHIPISIIAHSLHMISYEIPTYLNKRIKRTIQNL